MRSGWSPLLIAATAELVTLLVLLVNLATVHWEPVASVVGPIHGCGYLFVVVAAARHPRATRAATALALVPGIGGQLALRRLARGPAPAAPSSVR